MGLEAVAAGPTLTRDGARVEDGHSWAGLAAQAEVDADGGFYFGGFSV